MRSGAAYLVSVCALAGATCTSSVTAGTAAPPTQSIVAFFGGELRTPANEIVQRVWSERFSALGGGKTEFFAEYVDPVRFAGPEHEQRLAAFLHDRYLGRSLGVLLAADPPSLNFLLRQRDFIAPGVPVVFNDLRKPTLAQIQLPSDFVGVPVDVDAGPTVVLARRLRPEAAQVLIVTGVSDLDRVWERRLGTAAAQLLPSLPVRRLSSLPIEDIEREVAKARNAIILCGSFRLDASGRAFSGSLLVLERLKAVAAAPIFHIVPEAVGHGALAAVSVSTEAVAEQSANIAIKVLASGGAQGVVLPPELKARPFVDWREIHRWNIDEALLPSDAVVLFRVPTFWELYGRYALIGFAALLLQAALIALLLVQARRRQRAEREAAHQRSELAHLSRVTMLGSLSASLAHELNQPLAAILVNVKTACMELARRPLRPSSIQEILDAIAADDRRASAIIASLRSMFVKRDAVHEPCDVASMIRDALGLLRFELARRGSSAVSDVPADCPVVLGDRVQLQQVVINLVLNAADAMQGGTDTDRTVTVRARALERTVRLSVEDQGPGPPEEMLGQGVRPFFTTKKHGIGLGLTVCKSIVAAHGSVLRITRNDPRGTVAAFHLRTARGLEAAHDDHVEVSGGVTAES